MNFAPQSKSFKLFKALHLIGGILSLKYPKIWKF